MRTEPSWSYKILAAVAIAALAGVTIALGTASGIGIWLIGVVGGAALGAFGTLLVLGINAASAGSMQSLSDVRIDPITGLGNAERLRADLKIALAPEQPESHSLHFLALEGLKRYDDAYGELAADTLLRWLASRLRSAVGDRGTVYRMRGGSFAVLCPGDDEQAAAVRTDASTALFEVGDGFMVWSIGSEVSLPHQTRSAEEAIEIADRRARSKRLAAQSNMHLHPPDDPFGDTSHDRSHQEVGRLARAVGARLNLDEPQLDELEAAAQLRDIGNAAIPSVVFMNPGALPALEWQFVRLHTIVGERLLDGRFAMSGVGKLVRSSHERWDGAGYPDGLCDDQIPLAARIVFVCSAYEDMRAVRPHRTALSDEEALAELQKCSGGQFDPEVVRAFEQELALPRVAPQPAPTGTLRLTG